jgi:16S rRNA processing protein RimM
MIAIGRIAKSNGIRGEVRVNPLTHDAGRFSKLKAVMVGASEDALLRYTVKVVRFHRSQAVLKFGGIDTRDAADALREQFLFVEEAKAVSPKKGSYFIHDIVGMEVVMENGEVVGNVTDVWQMPANDVWVIQRNGKELLIPAVKEIIRSVDTQKRTIVIHAMEGLVE